MTAFQVMMTDTEPTIIPAEQLSDPRERCRSLEEGGILFFPESPFGLRDEDKAFLLQQRQQDAAYHKNIAYRPVSRKLSGAKALSAEDAQRMQDIMHRYTEATTRFLEDFLSPYREALRWDYGSFRSVEEQGRQLRLRARNDLLHVDAFPTRPLYGDRILRVFTNVSPTKMRVWKTSDTFEVLAHQFKDAVTPLDVRHLTQPQPSLLRAMGRLVGLKTADRSPYDQWMMDFHNFLKENSHFQETCRKAIWELPPGSSWMVYTDMVSHAVLSGQHALEQTFIVRHDRMVTPERAPVNILEALYGTKPPEEHHPCGGCRGNHACKTEALHR